MRDMTKGAPLGHLFFYAVPLLLGNWLQLAYNAVDSIIAGRFIGQDALAAEGIAGPVMNLVILAVSGLCIGAGVLMSEAFGAKNEERLKETLATTLLFGAALCCAVALLGVAAAPLILHSLAVPDEILHSTGVYLSITFLGAPFTFFYNALAAGLKSVGDSKTPLKFLAFSAVLNAVLDIVLIGGLGFGIVCSAVTTVVAEAASAIMAAWYMMRHVPQLCPAHSQWRIRPVLLGRILQYGAVTALQQAVQPVCKVLIQGQVNALGVQAIAAFNAVTRVDDFAFTPQQSIATAITTYIAQNRGANQKERIRPGFRVGIRLELCYWLLVGSLTWLLRAPVVSLFVAGQPIPRLYGAVLRPACADQWLPGLLPRHGQDDHYPHRHLPAGRPARPRSCSAGPPHRPARYRLRLCLRLVRHALLRDAVLLLYLQKATVIKITAPLLSSGT